PAARRLRTNTDVVAQQIHHAFISDRHPELACLLLELIEARPCRGPKMRQLFSVEREGSRGGAAAEFNRRENPAGRYHEARQPLFAPTANQWGKRQSAAIEGDESRSVGDRAASASTAAGRRRGAGEQDGGHRMGGDAAPERTPAPGCGGLVRLGRRWS